MTHRRKLAGQCLALAIVLAMAAGLRLTGTGWGELQSQHPDENHFTAVVDSLRARKCADSSVTVDACPEAQRRWLGIRDYLDTRTSTLNPYTRGFNFFVYGNLPLTLVRVVVEATGATNVRELGRRAAALADLFSILLLYFIAARLYGRRVALLAALFSALCVMQIQQSHFFTSDLFVNAFALPAVYCAVAIAVPGQRPCRQRDVLLSVGFGIAYGMALAAKISIFPLALLLPAAFLLRHPRDWRLTVGCLSIGALAALVTFRICQPYAFVGLSLNPQWIANILEQRAQASGEADMPWNLQWARRSYLYSFTNLTVWGLGLPLGIAAWAGFLYMGWRVVKGETRHALLWSWTAAYFTWQSLQFNPTMRYQLPVYPLLAMMAAWLIARIARSRRDLALAIGGTVVVLTAAWAVAFHGIYLRDEPRMAASRWILQNVPGAVNLQIRVADGSTYNQPLPLPKDAASNRGARVFTFSVAREGRVASIFLPHLRIQSDAVGGDRTVRAVLSARATSSDQTLAQAVIPSSSADPRGEPLRLEFPAPVPVHRGEHYTLTLGSDDGEITLGGATFANETDFDYALPSRVDGYDPFGGIYRGDLNLQVYWDDNADKLERFVGTLEHADYIFIPTNHQYAQITRLPERYPLTTMYYRELVGCPEREEIAGCYRRAQPGLYEGRLGFELAAVFESYPRIGPIVINDQAAEEAFTFYDHPKVLIFRKSAEFSADRVRSALESVDLARVVRLGPRQFDGFSDLMLPARDIQRQRAGGTWSELFRSSSLQNRRPFVAAIVWYVFISMIGLAAYPILRFALRALPDRGYPLGRTAGLLISGYLAWLAASTGFSYSRATIAASATLMLVGAGLLAWHQRQELREEWRSKRRYFVGIEALMLVLFLAALLLRLGNPDLWHPARGGERPMDFSYLNAIIRSTTFPPYDPWFAGGYINYYYFGLVIVGTPVKLLGIVPAIAYNLILPTVFAMVGLCAFSLGWNLTALTGASPRRCGVGGAAAAAFSVLLGNLATLRLIARWIRDEAVAAGEWYWTPSRVMPAGAGHEITEFPAFTFIYGDLHAHMLVLPVALLALSCACAFVASRDLPRRRAPHLLASVLAALTAGALYPTNLADAYTYLAILAATIAWTSWHAGETSRGRRSFRAAGAVLAFVALSSILYQPYHEHYSQAYGALDLWRGPFTPLSSYLVHWTALLIPIVWWMASETRNRIRSGLKRPVAPAARIAAGSVALAGLAAIYAFTSRDITITWIALPIAAWAALLILLDSREPGARSGQAGADVKRFVLVLIGTALVITVLVDVVVVRGDIGRQNTVFKFYLQAWILLAISAGAAVAWTIDASRKWAAVWRHAWRLSIAGAISLAGLFVPTAAADKVRDRWVADAPHTLDGMTFMNYVHHEDFNRRMDLSEDYRAIRWMQENVQGTPVIVEAHCSEYRWCTRFTVYTGLPGVVGWNFHQRQQRMLLSAWVTRRVDEIKAFYETTDGVASQRFLDTYGVRYIVVGQLERAQYGADGIAKFERFEGQHWRAVYRDGDTVIYETLE